MPLRIGETFAGYRILRLLGSGGMGEVYLVEHPRLPRHDALKVLRPDLSSDTSFHERFIREATWPQAYGIPTSWGYTTEENRTASSGSRWTTSTAPTQLS